MEGIEEFQAQIQANPTLFFDNVLDCGHWSAQDRITNSVFKNQRTTVKSCHGIGKTYISARIALAFLFAHKDSIVITTAPTFRQVENILWREMRSAAKKAKIPLGGDIFKTKYEIDEKRYALGLSSDKEDNFQGFHAEYLLVIADEAGGIENKTLRVMEALMTSRGTKILYIGNPTQGTGGFYDSFKNELYEKISVSCFDTPNFKRNRIKDVDDLLKLTREEILELPLVYPELVTPVWVFDRINDWGVDSPIFQSRVLAEFPSEGDDTLIKLSHLERSLLKEWTKEEWSARPRRNVIGIDVARFGSDTTVLIGMDNCKMLPGMRSYQGKDTMKTVGEAISLFNELGFSKEFDYFVVDDTGVGGGVTDRLVELGYNVLPINNASSPSDTDMFRDIKAEIYWILRQGFIDRDIRIEDTGRVIGDISSIQYGYTSNGKIYIIGKKEMKKKGMRSPDYADALALAYYGCVSIDGGDIVIEEEEGESEEDFSIVGNIFKKDF